MTCQVLSAFPESLKMKVIEALDEIRASKRSNVSAGYHVVPPKTELVEQRIIDGYTFIAYSVDFLSWVKCADRAYIIYVI